MLLNSAVHFLWLERNLRKFPICAHQMTKILVLQLQHQSFQWIFRDDLPKIGWFDLLALQGIFGSLLQHHSSKASTFWHSAFFTVQLSQLYVTTGKTIALTIQTFVSRVMSLLFNILSRFVIAFLPSNHLTSWLQPPSAVILEPQKRKSVTTSTFFPSMCCAIMGPDAMILVFNI